MDFKFDIDFSLLDKKSASFQRNLAYSVAQALNKTAQAIQTKIRNNVKARFHLRRTDFVLRQIKISTFANVKQQRPYVVIEVDQKPRLLLGKFEEGGEREPFVGKHVAVPVTGQAARPSWDQNVNARQYGFKALNFQRKDMREVNSKPNAKRKKNRANSKPYMVWLGRRRTFILGQTKKASFGGVFQRIGPKHDDIRMIYSFRGTFRVKQALGFVQTARANYEADFREEFYRRFLHIPRG